MIKTLSRGKYFISDGQTWTCSRTFAHVLRFFFSTLAESFPYFTFLFHDILEVNCELCTQLHLSDFYLPINIVIFSTDKLFLYNFIEAKFSKLALRSLHVSLLLLLSQDAEYRTESSSVSHGQFLAKASLLRFSPNSECNTTRENHKSI